MKGLLIFAAGLAIGAVAGACVIKNKVLADAKEEIEEVREYYRSKKETVKEEQPEVEPVTEEKEYKDIVSNNGYVNYNKPEKIQTPVVDPYIIDPSEFLIMYYQVLFHPLFCQISLSKTVFYSLFSTSLFSEFHTESKCHTGNTNG